MIPVCFVLSTPPRSVPGCGLGNRATQLWHMSVVFLCFFIFRPADPPVSAGAGLGNQAVLSWHRTRILSLVGFGVVSAYVVLATPPRSVPGCGLSNWVSQMWHMTVGFSCSFLFRPADAPPRLEPGAIWVFCLLGLWHRIV